MIKTCVKCKRELSIGVFNKKQGNKDGLDNRCRECKSQQYKESIRKNLDRRNRGDTPKKQVKNCTSCRRILPVAKFGGNVVRPDGLSIYCKECLNQRNRDYRRKNRDRINGRNRKFNDSDIGRGAHRRGKLKFKYGITLETHQQIYADQNGCCAICKRPVTYSDIHTDHNHETGIVRGLLCRGCNIGLGGFEDNPISLKRAIEYLGRCPCY